MNETCAPKAIFLGCFVATINYKLALCELRTVKQNGDMPRHYMSRV